MKAQRAWAVVAVLTALNFLNYVDRTVLSAVLAPMSAEFGIGDARAGELNLAFLAVYTVAAPLCGRLGDRWPRKYLVASGALIWSLATSAGGWVSDFEELRWTRVLVGVGEAGYATVAPTIIADLCEPRRRGRMLSWFYLAIPVGSALGYLAGGIVAEHWGWRMAFVVAGIPGIVAGLVALLSPEPKRGAFDEPGDEPDTPAAGLEVLRSLWTNGSWVLNTAGTTLMTFAMGGLAFWMPTFLVRHHGIGVGAAGTYFGGITVVAGVVGTMLGGYLGDRAEAQRPGGYFRVSGWGLALGAPLALAMPWIPSVFGVLAVAFLAEILLFLNTGPLNAALVGCVGPGIRAQAVAVNVFVIHALGDVLSPVLIGAVSDASHLGFGLSMTGIPLAVGGWLLVRGGRRRD